MRHHKVYPIAAAALAAALLFATSCSDEESPTGTPPPDNGGEPPRSWVLQSQLPSVYDLYGVFATSARTIAVGAGGVIVAHNGERWAPQLSPTTSDLRGIHGTSGGVVWAVGDGGTALRFDGVSWQEKSLASGEDLTAVWAVSPDCVYAASLEGMVFKYDGSDWSAVTRDYGSLHGVWASADTNVYAVGEQATICHYNGLFWNVWHDSRHPDVTFRSVWGASANNVLAVGDDGYAVRFDGAGYLPDPTPVSDTLNFVYGSGWGDPTVVGNHGGILRDASTGWQVEESGASNDLFGVAAYTDAVDREHRVAVGEKTILSGSSDWVPFTRGTMQLLNDVWGDAPDNVYVVGQAGTVLHFDGDAWGLVTTGEMLDLYRVWGDALGVSVADKLGAVYHYDGVHWEFVGGYGLAGAAELIDIWQIPGGYLVCVDGPNVYYMDDRSWKWFPSQPKGAYVTSIWANSNDDIFAVALGGGIYRFNGFSWTAMDSRTTEHLIAVWGDDRGRVFAVGYNGTVVSYDGIGSVWTKMNTKVFQNLHRVWGTSGMNVLAVGDLGTVLRFDGFDWKSIRIDTTEPLYGVWQDEEDNIYAVGGNKIMDGLIYRYQTTP
jgi:hypothetical protein